MGALRAARWRTRFSTRWRCAAAGCAHAGGSRRRSPGRRSRSAHRRRTPAAQAERDEEARTEALGAWLRGEESEEDRAALSGTRTLSERELFTGTSFALTGGSAEGRDGLGLGAVA